MSQGWQKCDDPSCGYTTRQVPLTLQRGAPMCTSCFRAHLHPAVSGVTDFCFLIKQFPLLNHLLPIESHKWYFKFEERLLHDSRHTYQPAIICRSRTDVQILLVKESSLSFLFISCLTVFRHGAVHTALVLLALVRL